MAIVPKDKSRHLSGDWLHNGDCLTQPEFHRLYEQMPENFKAELLDGVVFVCEPLGIPHAESHLLLGAVFAAYRFATPGVKAGDNGSVILGRKDEVQPDLIMRILPEYRGQSTITKKGSYIKGAPELVAEIAHSSRSIDLHLKKQRYARAGVFEYIVFCLDPAGLRWFDLPKDCELEADSKGILRSCIFPGLWVGSKELLEDQYYPLMDILNQGLLSAQHADFVVRLKARKSPN